MIQHFQGASILHKSSMFKTQEIKLQERLLVLLQSKVIFLDHLGTMSTFLKGSQRALGSNRHEDHVSGSGTQLTTPFCQVLFAAVYLMDRYELISQKTREPKSSNGRKTSYSSSNSLKYLLRMSVNVISRDNMRSPNPLCLIQIMIR